MVTESALMAIANELRHLRESGGEKRSVQHVNLNARPFKVKVIVSPKVSSKGQLQEAVTIEVTGEFDDWENAVKEAERMKAFATMEAKAVWEMVAEAVKEKEGE